MFWRFQDFQSAPHDDFPTFCRTVHYKNCGHNYIALDVLLQWSILNASSALPGILNISCDFKLLNICNSNDEYFSSSSIMVVDNIAELTDYRPLNLLCTVT